MSGRLDDLIRALSHPSIYPHNPQSVRVLQTHISVVFIAGDLVYKIKKPVDFGFLDFTTLEKRRFFCRQEVELNSRFSEGIYLGVESIYEGPSGVNLRGEGDEIEAAVLMRRVPEDQTMLKMLEAERITPEILDQLADRLAYFHSQAATGPEISSFGSPEVIYQNLRENFEQTEAYVGKTIDAETHKEVSQLAMDFLQTHKDLFRQRIRQGFIRDCHGDLHLDHVVILDEIMLYDCIEFNDRFRYGDTAADLAFLLMDLDFRGFPAFSEQISNRYADSSGDREILRLLPFYKSYRAFVRGKVLGFTLDEPEVSFAEKESSRAMAGAYFRLALAYMMPPPPPALVIFSGLMATGKSHLAERLGVRLGVEPLRSDKVRKEIHGLPPIKHQLDKYGQGIYRPDATERTYEALLVEARQRLNRGESVILDASFMRYRHRRAARELALATNAAFRIVECACPDEIIRQRLEDRLQNKKEPSDATWEIFPDQKVRFEPIGPEERQGHRVWDSTTNADSFLASLVLDLMCP
ncbi:MAG: AAA family ATPase [Desulfomonile tiedjei]|nr:AAA family ATPase [Desulfomonile tiedjei]